jgi:two-component system nitrogen regulation response regulator GlnG
MAYHAVASSTLPQEILLLDDDPAILTVLTRALENEGYMVRATIDIREATQWVREGRGALMITDVTMPGGNGLDALKEWQRLRDNLPVLVMSAHNMLLNAARAQELGAREFLPKPFDLDMFVHRVGQALAESIPQTPHHPEHVLRISNDVVLVGASAAMQEIYRTLTRLISNDLTVLIHGESGTGKELVARALHALGMRKSGPFIALNMAAIPKELIESALFGHEKGAFTGAHQRQLGAFERAAGGTLFLDEIGDMPADAQTRLLRVLQQEEFSPVGSTRTIKTNVRIVAATHHDLPQRIQQQLFREDLYYRLNVVPITVPPLRNRREDIAHLVDYFLHAAPARGVTACSLDKGAMHALEQHDWPGNIRALENTIYRLCALYGGAHVDRSMVERLLPTHDTAASHAAPSSIADARNTHCSHGLEADILHHMTRYFASHDGAMPNDGLYERLLPHFERPLLACTLKACGGNQVKAAALLGLNRNTLRKKLRTHQMDAKAYVGGSTDDA